MSPYPPPAGTPGSSQNPARRLLGLLALTAGAVVANLYYCQPLLGAMAAAFHVGPSRVTAVATATQLGYASGLLLIVPLGDGFERKRLILGTTIFSAISLSASAIAPSAELLAVAGYVTGVISVTPQLTTNTPSRALRVASTLPSGEPVKAPGRQTPLPSFKPVTLLLSQEARFQQAERTCTGL